MRMMKTAEAGLILLCLAGAAVSAAGHKTGLLVLFIAALGLGSFLLWRTIEEEKIENFLLQEAKQKKRSVSWEEREIEELEQLRRRSDFSALQYQINPHFLYNTLDTIRAHALINGQEDIALMTEKLSRFFRYAISSRETLVRIEEETDHIRDYYYIQKQRFGDRFEMEIEYEDDELRSYYIPRLVLQPLVENAITHGLEKAAHAGFVRVSIAGTETNVVLRVTDNGVGMSEEKLQQLNDRLKETQIRVPRSRGRNNGIAIQNVNARIRLTFGEDYGIHYRSAPGEGTVAVLTVPKVDDFSRAKYEELGLEGREVANAGGTAGR